MGIQAGIKGRGGAQPGGAGEGMGVGDGNTSSWGNRGAQPGGAGGCLTMLSVWGQPGWHVMQARTGIASCLCCEAAPPFPPSCLRTLSAVQPNMQLPRVKECGVTVLTLSPNLSDSAAPLHACAAQNTLQESLCRCMSMG